MPLFMKKETYNKMVEHLKKAYPREGCGFLIGKANRVEDIRPAENISSQNPMRRYEISPEEFVKVEKELRNTGMEIIGFYHSHPDVGVYFSDTDKEFAWEGYYYVVVGINKGEEGDCGVWIKKNNVVKNISFKIE